MERVRCCLCSSPPTPPVHHCLRNHVVCGKCSQVLGSSTSCPLENCNLETCPCNISSLLLSLMCPFKSIGYNMLPSKVDLDFQNSPNSMYTCPLCSSGVDLVDIQTLKLHLEVDHNPIKVRTEQFEKITIRHGCKLILKEEGSAGTFFLLSFTDSCLMLNHMWWDESRGHSLGVDDLVDDLGHGSDDDWTIFGNTSDIRSASIVQRLQLPMSFLPGEAITCELWLVGESDAKRTRAIIKNVDGLDCIICCKIVTPPVYHCCENHLICYKCLDNLPEEERERCTNCSQRVMRCRTASYILCNSHWYCSNQGMGCEHMMGIEDYEEHVKGCLKRRYYCPICSEGFDVLDSLRGHLASHPKIRHNYFEETRLRVGRGRYLLQMMSTDEYYLLIFKENQICLQHMPWSQKQEYYIKFRDVGCEWQFRGETSEVWKIPMLSDRHLTIPEIVLHPQSTLPIPILVQIQQ